LTKEPRRRVWRWMIRDGMIGEGESVNMDFFKAQPKKNLGS